MQIIALILLTISGQVFAMEDTSEPTPLCNCRTLWTIVYSSFVTILGCVWVAIHPNIPSPTHGVPVMLLRLKLLMLGLVAPELIILWALRQRFVAHRLSTKTFGIEKSDSGYFHTVRLSMSKAFLVCMGGVTSDDGSTIITADMVDEKSVVHIINIEEEDIVDKSKGDALSKGIAIIQTLWFLLQCLARRIEGLPVTELEIMAIAFAVLNSATYIAWWQKPLNLAVPSALNVSADAMEKPHYVPIEGQLWRSYGVVLFLREVDKAINFFSRVVDPVVWFFEPKEKRTRRSLEPSLDSEPESSVWAGVGFGTKDGQLKSRVQDYTESDDITFLAAVFLAIVVGAIHCSAWNSFFLTNTERWAWRVSSLTITITPLFILIAYFAGPWTEAHKNDRRLCLVYVDRPIMVIYTLSRIVHLMVALAALRSLPPDAYETVNWAELLPHFGL